VAVVPFSFEGAAVRVVTRDGEPWFVLADVCGVLDIKNPSDAAGRLKPHEKNTLVLTEGILGRGNPNVTVINEPGLYRLILRSDKKQAEPFQTWVVTDVLPSIRKTGDSCCSKGLRARGEGVYFQQRRGRDV
jgi:prophage antirepressor-like protein